MDPAIIIFITTLTGFLLGSFASLLIHRLHYDEKGILCGRSKCPKCNAKLGILNLVPLFSWLWQKGKCHKCDQQISAFYPLTEFIFGLTFFLFAQKFHADTYFIPIMVMVFFILVLFVYDFKFFEVDRRIAFPAIILALFAVIFRGENFETYLIGGFIGFLFYAAQYFLSGKKWVGAGDMELGLLMGLILGWKHLLGALFLAYIIGSLFAIVLLITRKANAKTPLPMGAFLMPATLVFMYNGTNLWNMYIQFLGI